MHSWESPVSMVPAQPVEEIATSAHKGLLAMTVVVGSLVEVFTFTAHYISARIPLPSRLTPCHLLNYSIIATGNDFYFDSLRGAPPPGEGFGVSRFPHKPPHLVVFPQSMHPHLVFRQHFHPRSAKMLPGEPPPPWHRPAPAGLPGAAAPPTPPAADGQNPPPGRNTPPLPHRR